MSSKHFKLGRHARSYDSRVPHLSAMLAGRTLPPIPAAKDWTVGMPANLGMMLNDALGDCTCAAFYHAKQVWTANMGSMITEPDSDVEMLYEQACGYNPTQGGEGPGGNEQNVLKYLMQTGAPCGPAGTTRDKLAAFIEVDPRHLEDVKRTILCCGVAYIGFNVPASLMPPTGTPPPIWTVDPSNSQSIGGHAVVLAGYDAQGAKVISWGQYYTMTWPFFSKFVDEVYAIADPDWFEKTGNLDPLGSSLSELQSQMKSFK